MHRAGYKSPGYKRALRKPLGARSPPLAGSLLLLLSRTVHDRAERTYPRLASFFPSRKARSRRHEAADLNDRTYERRYAFVAELRMPVAAHSVILKGSTFSSPRPARLKSYARCRRKWIGRTRCKFANCESKKCNKPDGVILRKRTYRVIALIFVVWIRRRLKRYPQMNPYRLDKCEITIFHATRRASGA